VREYSRAWPEPRQKSVELYSHVPLAMELSCGLTRITAQSAQETEGVRFATQNTVRVWLGLAPKNEHCSARSTTVQLVAACEPMLA
jgi:hypothetical protein